ncbi:MAG: hypothetical protein HY432_01650 [Candidatus Liptonbacteria bacterium]|nr:hypothetical protein [Candidatus Liptonbacteria bacterium]
MPTNGYSIKTGAEMRAAIETFVKRKRKSLGITGFPGELSGEMSCFAFGEFHNLLYRNLLYTSPTEWFALADPEILLGVYREVVWEIDHPGKRCSRRLKH